MKILPWLCFIYLIFSYFLFARLFRYLFQESLSLKKSLWLASLASASILNCIFILSSFLGEIPGATGTVQFWVGSVEAMAIFNCRVWAALPNAINFFLALFHLIHIIVRAPKSYKSKLWRFEFILLCAWFVSYMFFALFGFMPTV